MGYDSETEELEIEFPNGDVYRYHDVPRDVYDGLMEATSLGQYFHRNIRGKKYRFEKVRG